MSLKVMIFWERQGQSHCEFMASQMTKGFRLANEKLEKIESSLTTLSNKN